MKRKWKVISNFPEYQVSNLGEIRSLDRYVTVKTKSYKGNRWGRLVDIPSFEKKLFIKGKLLKVQCRRKDKRLYVTLCSQGKESKQYISRLVLIAFRGSPPKGKPFALHFPDSDPRNCRLNNLEWGSQKSNCNHTKQQGNTTRGTKNKHCKLTEIQVRRIRRLREQGRSLKELSLQFKLHKDYVSALCRGHYWSHI